ncbi:MAG: alcohol dehydrogenase catalytic domain-containing protein [Chitinispirillales bacterium]|jgi:threonine dehydrogenase-like Zn-dependent dehydrogenase|nr:alcohol dehydrogenase catalytic domain-containing protein [Chitinispirillales bacterium]
MESDAIRLYGKRDLRRETIYISPPKEHEILADVICCAVCASCCKVAQLGQEHNRVPKNLLQNPVILGHEFCAKVSAVGDGVDKTLVGKSIIVQPMVYETGFEWQAMGHSFGETGGYATKIKIPKQFYENGAIIEFSGKGFYKAALAEPLGCIIAAFRTQYHTKQESFKPIYGNKPEGTTIFLGGAGNMGKLAVQLWREKSHKFAKLLIYDRNPEKLKSMCEIIKNDGRIKTYSSQDENFVRSLAGTIDDVVVFAPSRDLVDLGMLLLSFDGCLNFFAGPFEKEFNVPINFHNIHYQRHHIVGSSGASGEDIRRALQLIENNSIDPSLIVSHIGGLGCVAEIVGNFAAFGGGKKLIYPQIALPITVVDSWSEKKENELLTNCYFNPPL